MKARIKKTGEVINIADYARVTLDKCDSWGNPIELGFDEVEILQENTSDIDWEARRFELVKEYLRGIMSDPNIELTIDVLAETSVLVVDAIIAKMKGGQDV